MKRKQKLGCSFGKIISSGKFQRNQMKSFIWNSDNFLLVIKLPLIFFFLGLESKLLDSVDNKKIWLIMKILSRGQNNCLGRNVFTVYGMHIHRKGIIRVIIERWWKLRRETWLPIFGRGFSLKENIHFGKLFFLLLTN